MLGADPGKVSDLGMGENSLARFDSHYGPSPRIFGWEGATIADHKSLRQSSSANMRQHERNVIGCRAVAPRGDTVKNAVFHLLGGQGCCLMDNLSNAFNPKHLSLGIKNFGDSVGIQDNAVVWLERYLLTGIGTHST